MTNFLQCTCRSNGAVQELLQCAPCPPPMLNYYKFKDYALNNSLCQVEVCNIAERCRPWDVNVTNDCTNASTTTVQSTTKEFTTFLDLISSSTEFLTTPDLTSNSTGSTPTTVDYTPFLTQSSHECESTCVLLVAVFSVVALIIAFAVTVGVLRYKNKSARKRRKTAYVAKTAKSTPEKCTVRRVSEDTEMREVINESSDKPLGTKDLDLDLKCISSEAPKHRNKVTNGDLVQNSDETIKETPSFPIGSFKIKDTVQDSDPVSKIDEDNRFSTRL